MCREDKSVVGKVISCCVVLVFAIWFCAGVDCGGSHVLSLHANDVIYIGEGESIIAGLVIDGITNGLYYRTITNIMCSGNNISYAISEEKCIKDVEIEECKDSVNNPTKNCIVQLQDVKLCFHPLPILRLDFTARHSKMTNLWFSVFHYGSGLNATKSEIMMKSFAVNIHGGGGGQGEEGYAP